MRRKLTLRETQEIQLDILSEFDRVCRDKGLRYFLAYGTVLGAVRHKGFIPWDDDIDVMMPRKDYDSLLRVFENNGRYRLYSFEIDNDYNLPLSKICDTRTYVFQRYDYKETCNLGVYIDIFVIDSFYFTSQCTINRIYKRAQRMRYDWKKSVSLYSQNNIISICKRVISLPYKLVGYRYFLKKYNDFCKSHDNHVPNHIGILLFGEKPSREMFDAGFFDEYVELDFENLKFRAPKDCDKYLKQMYGDYMALPPEEERKTHGFEAYIDE